MKHGRRSMYQAVPSPFSGREGVRYVIVCDCGARVAADSAVEAEYRYQGHVEGAS